MPTALVTGATSGIGATFATQLAARGDDLILVARDAARLEQRAAELRDAHGVDVETLPADLSDRTQLARITDRLSDTDRPIEMLVNNAGFGIHTRILAEDAMAHIDPAMEVMVRSVMVLSQAAARTMRERGTGTIINVGSTAGYVTMGVYSAVKKFVEVYTEALSNELHGTGVTATVLCPGYVRTEFHERAGIRTGRLPELAWVAVDPLVRDCLADAAAGKVVSIPSARYKVAIAVARLAPRPLIRFISGKLTSAR